MPLRRRISIVAAAVVAVAVAIAVMASYFVVRGQLINQVDSELTAEAQRIETGDIGALQRSTPLPGNPANNGGNAPYVQYVGTQGERALPLDQNNRPYQSNNKYLPINAAIIAVAKRERSSVLVTLNASDGSQLRVMAFPWTGFDPQTGQTVPIAVELARPLAPVQNVLNSLRWILTLLFLAVVALAALLARMATHRVLRPLAEVTSTAKLIGETDDLSQRIEVHEQDEVGQLATRFNEMLERLENSRSELDASVSAQRQLVADASHELRTPVTSLRTNIEVLLSGAELDEEDRNRLLTDVVEQSEELSTLVSDLIEVARGDTPPTNLEDIRLDRLAEEALDRARRNAPEVEFVESLHPVAMQGNAERMMRAINNLLDNATLHAGHGGPVELTVDARGVTVRDHGDGLADADLPYVFDRFYRGANSRARQGSGLGLAIVRQAAEQHGGTATAANAPDGGAVFSLILPGLSTPDDADDDSRFDAHPPRRSSAVGDDPRVTGGSEASAQQPLADGEDRDNRHQQQHALLWHSDHQGVESLDDDGRHQGQQRRM